MEILMTRAQIRLDFWQILHEKIQIESVLLQIKFMSTSGYAKGIPRILYELNHFILHLLRFLGFCQKFASS